MFCNDNVYLPNWWLTWDLVMGNLLIWDGIWCRFFETVFYWLANINWSPIIRTCSSNSPTSWHHQMKSSKKTIRSHVTGLFMFICAFQDQYPLVFRNFKSISPSRIPMFPTLKDLLSVLAIYQFSVELNVRYCYKVSSSRKLWLQFIVKINFSKFQFFHIQKLQHR